MNVFLLYLFKLLLCNLRRFSQFCWTLFKCLPCRVMLRPIGLRLQLICQNFHPKYFSTLCMHLTKLPYSIWTNTVRNRCREMCCQLLYSFLYLCLLHLLLTRFLSYMFWQMCLKVTLMECSIMARFRFVYGFMTRKPYLKCANVPPLKCWLTFDSQNNE